MRRLKKYSHWVSYLSTEVLNCTLHDSLVRLYRELYPESTAETDAEIGAAPQFFMTAETIRNFENFGGHDLYSYLAFILAGGKSREGVVPVIGYNMHQLIRFIAVFIEDGHTETSHLEKLRYLIPLLREKKTVASNNYIGDLFNEEIIDDLFYVPGFPPKRMYYKLSKDNMFLTDTFLYYLSKAKSEFSLSGKILVDIIFPYYIKHGLDSPASLTPEVMLKLADEIKNELEFSDDCKYMRNAVNLNFRIFASAMEQYPEVCDVFNMSSMISPRLLVDSWFTHFYLNGYRFLPFTAEAASTLPRRAVFTVKGLNKRNSKKHDVDSLVVTLDGLCDTYVDAMLRWMLAYATDRADVSVPVNYVAKLLLHIQELKEKNGNSLRTFSATEIAIMSSWVPDGSATYSSTRMRRSDLRAFLRFVAEDGLIDVDPAGDVFLVGDTVRKHDGGEALDLEIIKKVDEYLRSHSEESRFNKVHYVLFRMLCRLSFRISQLASLKIGDIRPSAKPGEFIILDESKTSGGSKRKFTIEKWVRNSLVNLYDSGEELRSKTRIEYYKDAIFIYENRRCEVSMATVSSFAKYLRAAEKNMELNVHLTAAKLRSSFITNVKNWGKESNVNEQATNAMTDHATSEAIYNNYYDAKIAVEEDAGIQITGDFYEKLSLSDKISDNYQSISPDKTASNGAGYCRNSEGRTCPPTCLICKDFITTVEHLPYFRMKIQELRQKKAECVTSHDEDDMDVLMELYASYELAILEKIKEKKNGIL